MSLHPKIFKQNFEGLARAHAQNISGARQHDDKENIFQKNLLLRSKATNHNFSTFVVFCCYLLPQQKNVANIKRTFFVKEIFLKKCFQCL